MDTFSLNELNEFMSKLIHIYIDIVSVMNRGRAKIFNTLNERR